MCGVRGKERNICAIPNRKRRLMKMKETNQGKGVVKSGAEDFGGCLRTFVPRSVRPFSAFMLASDDVAENYRNFIAWVEKNFSPFVRNQCVFRNEAGAIYVKCVVGDPSFGQGELCVKRLCEDNVYLKVEGATFPYCVNLLKFLDVYRYAEDGVESYGSPRHDA